LSNNILRSDEAAKPGTVDAKRRLLVFGGAATILAASFGTLLQGCSGCGEEEKPSTATAEGERERFLECGKTTRAKEFGALKVIFPELAQNPYLIFAIEDDRVYAFLECCSLNDLYELKILKKGSSLDEYMDTKKMWERAVGKNNKRDPYRTRVLRARDEKVSYDYIEEIGAEGIRKFSPLLKEADITNRFTDFVTPEMMLAICIQEVSPAEMPGNIKIKPKARLELMRMMCDAGWQPQKMPALFDRAISFGLGQMTLPTHDALQRGYGDETKECCIEGSFLNHTTCEQQILNMLLLTYVNLEGFSYIAQKCPNFLKTFEEASDERKGRFLTTIIAAYHNYGNRKSLRRRIKATLEQNLSNLETYRTDFIQSIQELEVAYKHARNSGALYSFVLHRANRPAAEDTKEDQEVPELQRPLPPEEKEEEDIIDDTLLVRRYRTRRGRPGLPYYTFTVPSVDMKSLMPEVLAHGSSLEDVKRFQGIHRYAPGDIIHLPIAFVREELKDRHFARIPIKGKSTLGLMDQYMIGGRSAANWHLALLYGTNETELRFPARLMKD